MTQSVLLVVASALVTWSIMRWLRSPTPPAKLLSAEEAEMGRANDVGLQLDGARDRAGVAEVERNRVALAKAVKAALWVTEARLNLAVPELLEMAQSWAESQTHGETWVPPDGVTQIEGVADAKSPWAAWSWKERHWRLEAEWRPAILPGEIEDDMGICKVLVDHELVLDMTISSKDLRVMWIDALTVGPWVSELLAFAGAQKAGEQALSSDESARTNQDRADKIHWS